MPGHFYLYGVINVNPLALLAPANKDRKSNSVSQNLWQGNPPKFGMPLVHYTTLMFIRICFWVFERSPYLDIRHSVLTIARLAEDRSGIK